jgi:hypothetical protein
MRAQPSALATFIAVAVMTTFAGCKPKDAAPPAAAAAPPASGTRTDTLLMRPGDGAALRRYLETVQETPAKRFDVEWNPDVVRIDRAHRDSRGSKRVR